MQVAIHAGAMFTDGGRILKLMQSNAKVMAEANRAVFGVKAFKRVFRAPLRQCDSLTTAEDTFRGFQNLLPADRRIERTVLASAEFIGENDSVIQDGQFYAQAGRRLGYLSHVFSDNPVELFVGLRNPGSFIPKALMLLPLDERQNTLNTTDLSCLSWLTMIEDIRDLAPDVKITLWRNEDSPLIWGEIMCAIAGLPSNTPLNRDLIFLSSLVSDAGKQRIQALQGQGLDRENPTRRTELADIFRQHALPEAIEEDVELEGWNEDILASFTELYEQDLARLQSMPEINFISP